MSDAHEYLRRPETPEERSMHVSKPEYDGSGWGPEEEEEFDVGTPDSVIRHPLPPPLVTLQLFPNRLLQSRHHLVRS
jgi:hypothetical protein